MIPRYTKVVSDIFRKFSIQCGSLKDAEEHIFCIKYSTIDVQIIKFVIFSISMLFEQPNQYIMASLFFFSYRTSVQYLHVLHFSPLSFHLVTSAQQLVIGTTEGCIAILRNEGTNIDVHLGVGDIEKI